MKIGIFVLLAGILCISMVSSAAEKGAMDVPDSCKGIWGMDAKLPFKASNQTQSPVSVGIASPDKIFSIRGSFQGLVLDYKGEYFRLDALINPELMEVLWSPDSRMFAINVSDGGLVGTWESYIYSIDSQMKPVPFNIRKIITPVSNKLLACNPREEANIGVAAWLKGGEEVLLIVEVPPHSSCRNMGAITGFRISIKHGRVVEQISNDELQKKWKHVLGCRALRRAG